MSKEYFLNYEKYDFLNIRKYTPSFTRIQIFWYPIIISWYQKIFWIFFISQRILDIRKSRVFSDIKKNGISDIKKIILWHH